MLSSSEFEERANGYGEQQMSHNSSKSVTSSKTEETEQTFQGALMLLREQKPKEAIPLLKKTLELESNHEEAKMLLEDALESLHWNTSHFCKNCGAFIQPSRDYPEIKFDSFCSRCGEATPMQRERLIGIAELIVKVALFGMFPILTFTFSVFPMWTFKWGGFYLEMPSLLSAIFMASNFTPFFVLLMLSFDPGGESLKEAFYGVLAFLDPLESIHPILFFTAEIFIFFTVIYLSFLLILTPIVYMHRIGHWNSKKHQKLLLGITSILVVLTILRRLSIGALK